MNKLVSREDQKHIQLEMLNEIDAFCTKNSIRYSLAFGTLLGAIRHKGFIPWDDDVDIMMPVGDMLRFKNEFHSSNMKYCDIDTESHFEYAFSRIASLRTFRKAGLVNRSYGVCIDLYPVIPISSVEKENDLFFEKGAKLLNIRLNAIRIKSFLCKILPVKTFPGFDYMIRLYHDHLLSLSVCPPYRKYYIIAGHISLRNRMIYDYDLFDKLIDVDFEEFKFKATIHFDQFLSLRYGDYMTLPPMEERKPYHGGQYYWIEG